MCVHFVCLRVGVRILALCIFVCCAATAAFPLGTPQAPRIITGPTPVLPPNLRNPAPVTTPTIMPLIRQIQSSALVPGGNPHPALVQQGPESGIIYTPYEYPYTLTPSILEYPIDSTGVLGIIIKSSSLSYMVNGCIMRTGYWTPITRVNNPFSRLVSPSLAPPTGDDRISGLRTLKTT